MEHPVIEIIVIALLGLAALAYIAYIVYQVFNSPADEQLEKVREWLLWAVTEAEKAFGGGTGKLKLRWVYDLFVVRFPWLVKVVGFELFSELVDDALEEMHNLLATNDAVAAYTGVEGAEE